MSKRNDQSGVRGSRHESARTSDQPVDLADWPSSPSQQRQPKSGGRERKEERNHVQHHHSRDLPHPLHVRRHQRSCERLDDSFTFHGPMVQTDNKASFIEATAPLVPMLQGYDMHRLWVLRRRRVRPLRPPRHHTGRVRLGPRWPNGPVVRDDKIASRSGSYSTPPPSPRSMPRRLTITPSSNSRTSKKVTFRKEPRKR